MELPSERSTSARIDSNEVVEVNEENNDGEGDDECAPAPLPVVLVLVGGGGHDIKGASCFVRLGVLIIMMLSGCSLEVCVGRIELLPGRLSMDADCAAGGDLKVCLPRDGAEQPHSYLPTIRSFLFFESVSDQSDRSCVASPPSKSQPL